MSPVMNDPAYPPGRVVAKKAHEYFTRQREQMLETRLAPLAPVASAETIETVIGAAFRASLRREETYVPRLSLAILAQEEAVQPLVFDEPLRLTPGSLARVSPAVARSGLHVAVWNLHDELYAWGIVRSIPISCGVIEVAAPGLLVIKHRPSEPSRKFVNVAVLEGDRIKIVDEGASATADCPPLVSSLLGCDPAPRLDSVDPLVELAVSMRAHGRGGTLLVVPSDSDLWRESIVHPMPYAVRPGFVTLGMLAHEPGERRGREWEADLSDAVETIAGLTAVDGATVITDQYELIAFGAKIARRDGHLQVEQVTLTEPIEDAVPVVVHPTRIGGTRHLSAAQFVNDQPKAMALVASQDGRFTVFSWSRSETMVHAYRVDALLL
jgi:hypothetical protein